MRPRGTPPMPSARSSDSAPVGIASQRTWAPSSPIRMTVPLPNSRSICVSAPWRAASRALAAFSSSVTGMVLLLGSCWSGQSNALPRTEFPTNEDRNREPPGRSDARRAARRQRPGSERLVGGARGSSRERYRVSDRGAKCERRGRRAAQRFGQHRRRHVARREAAPPSGGRGSGGAPAANRPRRAGRSVSSRCRRSSSPEASWISTASARGCAGAATAGPPTDSSPASPAHALDQRRAAPRSPRPACCRGSTA